MLGFYLALIDNPSDKEKFTEIYNHYKDMMHQKAMSILHNTALAEEAVQESFLKITKNISKISSPVCSKTAAFIVIIVRNTSYDILRTEKPNDIFKRYNESVNGTADQVTDRRIYNQIDLNNFKGTKSCCISIAAAFCMK